MAALIASACLLASPLASAARADDAAAPIADTQLDSTSPDTSRSDTGPSTSEADQTSSDTDPVSGQQPGQTPGSPPPDGGNTGGSAPTDGGVSGDGGATAEVPPDPPADGAASTDGGSARDDGGARPSDSNAQHESAATANSVTETGSGEAGAPPSPPSTFNTIPPAGPAAGTTIPAPMALDTADFGNGFLDLDTGGLDLLLPHSARCGFCYDGVRFAAWLTGAAPGSELQRHSTATGEAKASALSLIAFAWAPDPLTAQLFRLLGGGGGAAALFLFGFLAVLAGIVLFAPDLTRAFRVSTVTWRPSLYVRPLELPG